MVVIYHLLAIIDVFVYGLASSMFRVIYDLATTSFFTVEQISDIANRIYIVVGVLMLFKLVVSAIQYMINPDTFDDKEKGLVGILKKTAISIALIVLVPSIFKFMIELQGPIVKTIPSIILGSNASEKTDDESIGFDISFRILSSFVRAREGKGGSVGDSGTIHDLWSFQEHVTDGCPPVSLFGLISTDNCQYDYMIIISTLAGGFLCYVLLSMILDIAIRTIKFGIIQILAPIPISSYVLSKDKLNKFVKTASTVYFDLFIRMGIVYFIIFAIKAMFIENGGLGILNVNGGGIANTGDWFRNVIVNVALIFGLLMFAKNAPKFISELLGLPDVGAGDMADMFKPAWQRSGGAAGALLNPTANAVANLRQARRMGRSRGEALRRAAGGFGKGMLDSFQGVMAGDDWSKMRSRHENAVKRSGQKAARAANFERDRDQTESKTDRFKHFMRQMGVNYDDLDGYREQARNGYNTALQNVDNDIARVAHQMNTLSTSDPDYNIKMAQYRQEYRNLQQRRSEMVNNKDAWVNKEAYRLAATESVNTSLTDMNNIIRNGTARITNLNAELSAGVTDDRRAQIELELEKLQKDVTEATTKRNAINADVQKEIKLRADQLEKYDEGVKEAEGFKIGKHATTYNAFDTYFGGTGSRGKVYLDFAETLSKNRSNIYTGEAMTKMRQNADALINVETGGPITHSTQFSSARLLSAFPAAKKEYTYSEISDLLTRAKNGNVSEKDLQEKYGFENVGMVQSAFEDLEKQFAKDYINANIAAINGTVSGNVNVRLKNPDKLLNPTITEWWDRFEDTILGAGLPPEEARKYREEFLSNPGSFIAGASSLKEKLTTRGTRYVDAERPKDGK